ncbi:urea transporter [Undibacterium sp.]|uniref:urea transporter n=1 Tax=Undibacterium sp. TaxID=1914977 RepID=UPI00374CDC1E
MTSKRNTGAGVLRVTANALLHGFSQIYCQRSALTGAALLLALCVAMPQMAATACLALAIATLCGLILSWSYSDVADGLYGYNAALCGAGLAASFQAGSILLLWAAAAGVLCATATHLLRQWVKLPVLTSPFIMVMLLAVWLGPQSGLQVLAADGQHYTGLAAFTLHAVAQISFIGGTLSPLLGLLVLAALALHHRRAAMWAMAAGLSVWCAAMPGTALDSYLPGITLNCMLSAICLTVNRRGLNARCGGIAATAGIGLVCAALSLKVFTLPFVAACWIVLASTREEKEEVPVMALAG